MKLNEFNTNTARQAANKVAGAAGNAAKNMGARVGAAFGHTDSKVRLGSNKVKKQAKKVAAKAFDVWADYMGNLVTAGKDIRKDPAGYKTEIEKWASAFFKIPAEKLADYAKYSPTGNLHRAAKEYIGAVTTQYMLAKRGVRESTFSPIERLIFETNALDGIFPRTALFEAAKNLHMEHLEDLILNQGAAGVEAAKQYVLSTADMLRSDGSKAQSISVKFDGCVHEDTVVLTTRGDMKIKDLISAYNDGEKISVYGRDLDSTIAHDVPTPVIGESVTAGDKNWVELTFADGSSIKLTEDHEVHTSNRGWVAASKLTEDDDVTEL